MQTASECKEIIKPLLSKRRYHHSCCVAKEAKRLAKKYGADAQKAEIAGMLHDITKELPDAEQLKMIARFDIMLSRTEKNLPGVWHAITGALYAEQVLGIQDAEILSAIRWHTSGKGEMTLLDKVLFVADFTSADRDYPDVEVMRRLSDKSLEKAMLEGIRYTVQELFAEESFVEYGMMEAYNEALQTVKNKKKERSL